MTNMFTYRDTYCKSCRYNYDTGIECGEWANVTDALIIDLLLIL